MATEHHSGKIISRKEAKVSGLKHYYTGEPCKRGHIEQRLVSTCQCCKCLYLGLKQWRTNNREESRRRDLKWKANNRERMKECGRARYALNPEKYVEKTKRYYRKNSEYVRLKRKKYHYRIRNNPEYKAAVALRGKKWRKLNPERAAINAKVNKHRRRAKEASAVGSFSSSNVKTIYKLQRGKCACCKIGLNKKYHVDHIVPLARGGTNYSNNLQLLCKPCNLTKSARDPIEFMQSMGRLL